MPADSEHMPERGIDLPRTWRPLGVRLAVLLFGGMLLVVCGATWFAFDDDVRARFTTFQRGTLIFLGALFGSVLYGMARCRVSATKAGLTVVNGYRRYDYEWAQVLNIQLPRGAPWAILDLADGTSRAAVGIQGSDGPRAHQAVAEIRQLL